MVTKQGFLNIACLVLVIFSLVACQPVLEISAPTVVQTSTAMPTSQITHNPAPNPEVTTEFTSIVTITPQAVVQAGSWKTLPVLPVLSSRARDIYAQGQERGNNPKAFSKIGDGEIATNWFLAMFDGNPESYNLGDYSELSIVIDYFTGSFGRRSLAALPGFNTTRILDPLFAPNEICEVEESPLECELHQHRPSFAFISLGTNQVWAPDIFDTELRRMVEICIQNGVVPILATKGDNLEGDYRINTIIAEVAIEYEVPLWNFWLSLQSLPDQGLQPDSEHLTWAINDFSNAEAMQHAWPVRNLTALRVLQILMDTFRQQ